MICAFLFVPSISESSIYEFKQWEEYGPNPKALNISLPYHISLYVGETMKTAILYLRTMAKIKSDERGARPHWGANKYGVRVGLEVWAHAYP